MSQRITEVVARPSLNQVADAAICTIEAQTAGPRNAYTITVLSGTPFEANNKIQSYLDQYGNVNLIVPHPSMPQHLWVAMTWQSFAEMFQALHDSAKFSGV